MIFQDWQALRFQARFGDADAEFEIGLLYDNGISAPDGHMLVEVNPRKAVFWYKRAAEHGQSNAQNSLGYCLDVGRGVRKNQARALFWYKRAFNNGNAGAANNLATVYRDRGKHRRAFFWYQQAAETGDGDALVAIGKLYYYGIGVERSYQNAIRHYEEALESEWITEAGERDAMYYLGVAFFEGNGVEQSSLTAKKWFELADEDGSHQKARKMLLKFFS